MIHNSETEKLFKAKESTKKRMQLKEKKKDIYLVLSIQLYAIFFSLDKLLNQYLPLYLPVF